MLGELKVAALASGAAGGVFSDREIVAMATSGAAGILGWQSALGSLEKDRRADLMVIDGAARDPYRALLRANETDIRLVMVNGTPRLSMPRLMGKLGAKGGRITIGGEQRVLHTAQASADPVVGQITLDDAMTTLRTTLGGLGGVGADPDQPLMAEFDTDEPRWLLALDELAPSGRRLRQEAERLVEADRLRRHADGLGQLTDLQSSG